MEDVWRGTLKKFVALLGWWLIIVIAKFYLFQFTINLFLGSVHTDTYTSISLTLIFFDSLITLSLLSPFPPAYLLARSLAPCLDIWMDGEWQRDVAAATTAANTASSRASISGSGSGSGAGSGSGSGSAPAPAPSSQTPGHPSFRRWVSFFFIFLVTTILWMMLRGMQEAYGRWEL